MKRILIACEFSGIVREAFKKVGWDAWSYDLLPTEIEGQHIQNDVLNHLNPNHKWDMMIAFPPCTHLAVSGARWFSGKLREQQEAILFVEKLWKAPIGRIAIENPVGVLSTKSILGKPTQIINPWEFGEPENKRTCLWLKNLPPLKPTKIIPKEDRKNSIWKASPGPDRWKNRSRTFQGISDAMAEQWGSL